MRPRRYTDAQADEAIRLRVNGVMWTVIATDIGLPNAATVYNLVRARRPEQYFALVDEGRRASVERKRAVLAELGKRERPWTDNEVMVLRADWAVGETAAAIARSLGRSRGSVIGKASRLKLAPRPSPIRRAA